MEKHVMSDRVVTAVELPVTLSGKGRKRQLQQRPLEKLTAERSLVQP